MSLAEYQKKRDFGRTPEPEARRVAKGGASFVIQKHAASHLHYDFRLELDGVLKSWAVPKGPSLDPADRRLAVAVEDHPIDYGGFEGIIPEGEYGGGTVMVWDRGTWESLGDPGAGYRSGHLKFHLHGEKLSGAWVLIKSTGRRAGQKGNEWFLMKVRDAVSRSHREYDVTSNDLSVLSGRSLDQIAGAGDRVWTDRGEVTRGKSSTRTKSSKPSSSDRRKATKSHMGDTTQSRNSPTTKERRGLSGTLPAQVDVQLATLVNKAPVGDAWLHEIKLDGYRMLCRIEDGSARFLSRNHQDWSRRLSPLVKAAGRLHPQKTLLDGEVVVVQADGVTDFQALQNAFATGDLSNVVYYVFDLLFADGQDLRSMPLEQRKAHLAEVLRHAPASIRLSEHVIGHGAEFFAEAGRLGLEGIISKLKDRPYVAGRSTDWVKVKTLHSGEFVIGGFTVSRARDGFSALLLGYNDESGHLTYCGKVGTGFSHEVLRTLRAKLDDLRQTSSPFLDLRQASGVVRGAHWVRPVLVGQIAFANWTRGGQLRQPRFLGLREDKPASLVQKETAVRLESASRVEAPGPDDGRKVGKATSKRTARPGELNMGKTTMAHTSISLTSPQRVLYADAGITKVELAEYLVSVADRMLPHVVNRPIAIVRCPEGADKACFFQKHPGAGTPDVLRRIPVTEKAGTRDYLVIDDVDDLVALAQIGALELHLWGSRADRLEQPDRLIFDLDPDPEVEWERVVESAWQLREFFEAGGLKTFLKTTGGKGLHVVIPIQRRHDWDEVKQFCKSVAERVEQLDPGRYVATMSKSKRKGKIFLDYLRNGRGATAIAPYSPRARAGAPVAVPLDWDELTTAIRSNSFTIRNLAARLNARSQDPWAEIAHVRQSLTGRVRARLGIDS